MARRDHDSSTGFREFWETKQKKAASRNLTFVQVEIEPTGAPKKTKKRQASNTPKPSVDVVESIDSQETLNRRQQVYLAQKRHRARKTEYAQSLEEQILQLRKQYDQVKCEGHNLAVENAAISRFLISHGVMNEEDLAPPPSSILDPNLDLGKNDLFDASPPPSHASMASSGSDSEGAQPSRKNKIYALLEQLDIPDEQLDASYRAKIKECRDLLLKDILPFERDEAEEKKTWDRLADLVLDGR